MKHINVVGVSIIVGGFIAICVMALSITHAAAFFERSGYHKWFAVAGVVAIELLFIYGSSLTLWLWLQEESIPLATKVATGLGITVNLYSNLTSGIAQDGKPIVWMIWKLPVGEPVIAGVLITLIYIVAELVISDAIKAYRRKKPSSNPSVDDRDKIHTDRDDIMTTPVTTPDIEPDIEAPEVARNDNKSDSEPDKQPIFDLTQLSLQDKRISDGSLIMTAKQYRDKHGKLPTVRELTKHANSQYQAEKVLRQLRKTRP
jgi:hypothetical protein